MRNFMMIFVAAAVIVSTGGYATAQSEKDASAIAEMAPETWACEVYFPQTMDAMTIRAYETGKIALPSLDKDAALSFVLQKAIPPGIVTAEGIVLYDDMDYRRRLDTVAKDDVNAVTELENTKVTQIFSFEDVAYSIITARNLVGISPTAPGQASVPTIRLEVVDPDTDRCWLGAVLTVGIGFEGGIQALSDAVSIGKALEKIGVKRTPAHHLAERRRHYFRQQKEAAKEYAVVDGQKVEIPSDSGSTFDPDNPHIQLLFSDYEPGIYPSLASVAETNQYR